jgi:hypothetical protein
MKTKFKNEKELLQWALKGNSPAVNYCLVIGELSQLLDDLIDGDKPVTRDNITHAFWIMLCELPANPFFVKNQQSLMAVLSGAFNAWLDSNVLEQGSEHDKSIAFVLRDSLVELVCHCSYLIGGFAWLRQVSPTIRRFILDETLTDYKAALNT